MQASINSILWCEQPQISFPQFCGLRAKYIKARGLWSRSCLPKNSFLKVSVSLGGFGPSVAHEKHSVRRRCVQATKNNFWGRNLLSPWRHWAPFVRPLKGVGVKIDVCENPVVYASTWDWSSLYGAIHSEPETAAQSSCSHFWVSLGTLMLSLFWMHRSGSSYCDASGDFCLPSLRVPSSA